MTHLTRPNAWVDIDASSVPNTQLSYALLTDPAPLTVSPVGYSATLATLEFVITNQTADPIVVVSIALTLQVGTSGANITPTTSGILTEVSDTTNWLMTPPQSVITDGPAIYTLGPASGGNVTLAAGGSVVVRIYQMKTVEEPGNTTLTVKEMVQSTAPAFMDFLVTTFPAGFYFNGLSATVQSGSALLPVAQVANPASVTLVWNCSVIETTSFTILYSSATLGQQTATPSKVGKWQSPSLTGDTVFTLMVTVKMAGGQKLTASLTTVVSVRNPSLVANSVGIGTAKPQNALHVYTGASHAAYVAYPAQVAIESNADAGLALQTPTANVARIFQATPLDGNSAGLTFDGPNRAIRFFTTNGTERMCIDQRGNVGVGVPNPGFPVSFPDAVGDKISLHGQSGAHYGLGIALGLLQIHAAGSGDSIAFGYGSSANLTETMRISGSGGLELKGTLSQLGDPNTNAMRFTTVYTNYTNPDLQNDRAEICNDLDTDKALILAGNTRRRFVSGKRSDRWVVVKDCLTVDHDLYVARNFWMQFGNGWEIMHRGSQGYAWWSDSRFKCDVQPVPAALEKVRQLRGVTFHWNEEAKRHFTRHIDTAVSAGPSATEAQHTEVRQKRRDMQYKELAAANVGVVAQEVEAVLPEAVTTDADGYKSVRPDKLIALLIEAIKEQDRVLTRQQAEIDRLKQDLPTADRQSVA